MEFRIENMTCGGCVRSVTRAIHSVDPDARVEADPALRTVRVESNALETDILRVLEGIGYPAAT
jgi:copper chaperone